MLQFIIAGLVIGSIYALAASGLVITYVSTGILNFAFGSLAYLIARLYYYLHVEQGWDILPAAVMSIFVAAPLLGLFLYVTIFRFLRLSSQLIKVVVTVGIAVTIPPLLNIIFGNVEIFYTPGLAPAPVSVYQVFGTAVTLDQVITYACLLAIVVVGAIVLRFTEAGLNVRAMVDSEAMTSLSGANPSRIAAGVWIVSTFIAGLVGVLAAPIISLDAGKFTLIVAAAFAAVIAARLRSIPVAVVVGLLMGIAGSLVEYFLPPDSEFTANVRPSIPFAFIVIALIYNTIRSGRVNEDEGVGGALDRAITPHGGSRLAASADSENPYPRLNFFFPVVVFAIVCLMPLILKPYWLGLLSLAATLAVVFLAYTLVTGEGGMLWLCQVTFAGVGALTTAQLATKHGWDPMLAIVAGGIVAAAIGTLLGFLTIRLGNLYVALVTLTFGLLMETLVFSLDTFRPSGSVVAVARPSFAVGDQAFTYLTLGIFAVLALLIVNLRRSTTGLALNAVRWSETASRTMGISVLQVKVLISALAAFVAGVGGGLYAVQQKQALPDQYATLIGLGWLAVVVTFGVRSNIAALLAAIGLTITPALFVTYTTPTWSQLPLFLFGVGAILLAKNPEGTVHMQAMQFQKMLRRFSGTRAVPAATAHAGRHDPRLAAPDDPAPLVATNGQADVSDQAEVTGS
ncbi:MAG TPA: ABC transporter permease [Acidimicrobiia bacterium]|nr:ABC transporter permease [Acidimicrobiia bacterium]